MRVPRVGDWPAWQRDGLMAVACFGLGSLLLALRLPLTVRFGTGWSVPGWAHLVPLAGVCCAQLLRTRAPIAGLLSGLAIAAAATPIGLSLGVLYVLADLLYSATLNGSLRANRIIIGAAGSVVLAAGLGAGLATGDWRQGLLAVLGVGVFPLIPVWWANEVRAHRAIADSERARADQVARIAELDRRAAVTAERSRMARDLHDVVAGHLSAIAIQSEAALSMVDGDPRTMRTVLASVRENSVASLTEMRAMIGLLQSEEADEPRTAPARLADLGPLLDSARAAGLTVRAHLEVAPNLPAALDLSAYRIVQEALTNAVKHAPGGRAEVSVSGCDGRLVIDVTSDAAAAATTTGGTGLTSMRERAHAVGGVLTAGPCEAGWRVRAELPVPGVGG
ncbi:sensor histidine kinase [Nocardia wallacei]|uniref:sensor histidine kinase n=1 Tax=Nocardia wallacei TaxID=480035 RepID=UPI002455C98E|nr:histidine kinase [Nocardia wallacei]